MNYALSAQYNFLGADAYGRANSLVAVSSFSSVYHNPGAVGDLDYSFLSVGYFKVLPVEGFNTVGLQGVFANNVVNAGFTADSFGDRYYRESRFGLVLAKKKDKVSIGAKLSYMGVSIHEMSNRNTLLGEVGMLVKPSKYFDLGLHLINFTGAKLYGDINLPTVISFGAALNPSDKVTLSAQVDYILKEKPKIRAGLNYILRKEIALSCGVNPELKSIHLGTLLSIKQYGFSFAVASHPNAGLAQNLSLIYKFNE